MCTYKSQLARPLQIPPHRLSGSPILQGHCLTAFAASSCESFGFELQAQLGSLCFHEWKFVLWASSPASIYIYIYIDAELQTQLHIYIYIYTYMQPDAELQAQLNTYVYMYVPSLKPSWIHPVNVSWVNLCHRFNHWMSIHPLVHSLCHSFVHQVWAWHGMWKWCSRSKAETQL